jgi:hypothetical protein
MQLFDSLDVAEMIRLVPHAGTSGEALLDAPPARPAIQWPEPPEWVLLAMLPERRTAVERAGAAVGAGWSSAADATRVGVAQLRRLGVAALVIGGDLGERIKRWAVARVPAAMIAADLMSVGRRVVAWWEHRRTCAPDAPAADGTGGSGHRLLAIAGLDSASAADGRSFPLDVEALGYASDEVSWYSYSHGPSYDAVDTRRDLHAAARRLRSQLREMQRSEPGREVDLVAHSQGGVVIDLFLRDHYDPADPTLPPIGTVVTLSSPHEGAPLATVAEELGIGAGDSVGQLAPESSVIRELWSQPLPDGIDFTSVGASDDVVVPADRIDVPGARMVTIVVDGLGDHDAIGSDPEAMRAVRAALEGGPLPCVGFVEGMRGAATPVIVSRVESAAGTAAGDLASAMAAMGG